MKRIGNPTTGGTGRRPRPASDRGLSDRVCRRSRRVRLSRFSFGVRVREPVFHRSLSAFRPLGLRLWSNGRRLNYGTGRNRIQSPGQGPTPRRVVLFRRVRHERLLAVAAIRYLCARYCPNRIHEISDTSGVFLNSYPPMTYQTANPCSSGPPRSRPRDRRSVLERRDRHHLERYRGGHRLGPYTLHVTLGDRMHVHARDLLAV